MVLASGVYKLDHHLMTGQFLINLKQDDGRSVVNELWSEHWAVIQIDRLFDNWKLNVSYIKMSSIWITTVFGS